MFFEPSIKRANYLLESFLKNKLKQYDSFRNYDFSSSNEEQYVSQMSPYVSSGIINEIQILKKLSKNKIKSDKYIQEIFWRVYWKGWLEHNEAIWFDYKNFLNSFDIKKYKNYTLLIKALKGETNITPYDIWYKELKKTGYLHNHARMWFASIWIHYLGLPWQIGANLFLKNLLDGDIASNTLSWRWVAGTQTIGKKYIATVDNINKYSLGRFKPFNLPKLKNITITSEHRIINKIRSSYSKNIEKKHALLILENNLNPTYLLNNLKFTKIIFFITFNSSELKTTDYVKTFKNKLLTDIKSTLDFDKKSIYKMNLPSDLNSIINICRLNNIEYLVHDYVTISYQKDIFIKSFVNTKSNIKLIEVLGPFYKDSWQYCKKGFFNFKNKIPKILEKYV